MSWSISNKIITSITIILFLSMIVSFNETKEIKKITTSSQLGEKLFFDPILSKDRTISCSSCHIPSFAFADTVAFSKGVEGKLGKRNAPSCMNLSARDLLFYDGRAMNIEDQVKFPIEDANEMNLPIALAVKRLQEQPLYVSLFKKIHKSAPTEKLLKLSIADFERTLESAHTKFDVYMQSDTSVFSASEIRGREIFMGDKAKCFDCHFSPDFTGDEFRNIGLYDEKKFTDKGRYDVTKNKNDLGRFKVPGLRNVAITGPYMHNGMFKTLREVIDYYDNPSLTVPSPINMDTLLSKPIRFTAQEKVDLENFLRTLTDGRFVKK